MKHQHTTDNFDCFRVKWKIFFLALFQVLSLFSGKILCSVSHSILVSIIGISFHKQISFAVIASTSFIETDHMYSRTNPAWIAQNQHFKSLSTFTILCAFVRWVAIVHCKNWIYDNYINNKPCANISVKGLQDTRHKCACDEPEMVLRWKQRSIKSQENSAWVFPSEKSCKGMLMWLFMHVFLHGFVAWISCMDCQWKADNSVRTQKRIFKTGWGKNYFVYLSLGYLHLKNSLKPKRSSTFFLG